MSKRKIIAAAKRAGLKVVSAEYAWVPNPGEMVAEWEVEFCDDIDDLYAEFPIQYFSNSAEAIEWIESLQPAQQTKEE